MELFKTAEIIEYGDYFILINISKFCQQFNLSEYMIHSYQMKKISFKKNKALHTIQ